MTKADGVRWLRDFLGSEVKSTVEVKASARDAGLGESNLKVARAILDVVSIRKNPMGPFFLCLPGVDHAAYFKASPNCGVDEMSDKQLAVSLVTKWYKLREGSSAALPGLFEQVEWVAEHILLPMSYLKVSDIPCGGALDLLLLAKENPLFFRDKYDSKRMPTRGAVPGAIARRKDSRRKASSDADGLDAIDRLLGSGGKDGV